METFDAIFCSDGAFSAARSEIISASPDSRITQNRLGVGYISLKISPPDDGSYQLESFAVHQWPRDKRFLGARPNADGTFAANLVLPLEGPDSFSSIKN